MTPDLVVDIGNTRVKWGRCRADAIVDAASLRHDVADWHDQATKWAGLPTPATWVISSVVPKTLDLFMEWLGLRGDRWEIVSNHEQIPIRVDVDDAKTVGRDRLLGALAAQHLFPKQRLLVIDAGSAVTVNLVDDSFRGGAIFPGLGMLSRSLHEFTAKLPLVSLTEPIAFPGRDTAAAIRSGLCSVLGGVVERIAKSASPDQLVLTGGDGSLLDQLIGGPWPRRYEPLLTLFGLLIAARPMPGRHG